MHFEIEETHILLYQNARINSKYLEEVKTESIKDVIDHIPRPAGRPKKSQIQERKIICKICLKNHDIQDCPFYPEWRSIIDKYKEYSGDKRRCSLCSELGHTIRTCPIRMKARETTMQ